MIKIYSDLEYHTTYRFLLVNQLSRQANALL